MLSQIKMFFLYLHIKMSINENCWPIFIHDSPQRSVGTYLVQPRFHRRIIFYSEVTKRPGTSFLRSSQEEILPTFHSICFCGSLFSAETLPKTWRLIRKGWFVSFRLCRQVLRGGSLWCVCEDEATLPTRHFSQANKMMENSNTDTGQRSKNSSEEGKQSYLTSSG